jgi:hypothetical protein
MSALTEALKDELDGEPSASRALKILDQADELGWTVNPACSFVIRLTRDDAVPFFARWDLAYDEVKAKRSWRFAGARAANGQALNYNDIKVYLNDPDVIQPDMPSIPEDDSDESVRTALGALKILTEPDPAYINGPPGRAAKPEPGFTDWGALLLWAVSSSPRPRGYS